jgi:hypothetical protein
VARSPAILAAGDAEDPGSYAGSGGQQYGFYLPVTWRGFHDFGAGFFGDQAVHSLGVAHWALNLQPEYFISVERIKAEGTSPFTYRIRNEVKCEFAARGSMPPLTLYWEDGVQGDAYLPPGMTAEQARKIPGTGPQVGPAGGGRGRAGAQQNSSGYAVIFSGTKGYMAANGADVALLPGSRWAEYKLPNPYLPRSPGANASGAASNIHPVHLRDWVRACKGGAPACSNFSVAGPYTEWLVLGGVASHYEGKLKWDNTKMEFTNNKGATKWIKPTFRKGWELEL